MLRGGCRFGQVMLSKARLMFLKHRQGHLLPVIMNANVVDSSFVAVMQQVQTSDEYIWFYSNSHTICGASQGSLSLLGVRSCMLRVLDVSDLHCECVCVCVCQVDSTDIDEGGVSLSHFIPQRALSYMVTQCEAKTLREVPHKRQHSLPVTSTPVLFPAALLCARRSCLMSVFILRKRRLRLSTEILFLCQ